MRFPNRPIPKNRDETLDEYFERRDRILEIRAEELDRILDRERDLPDEPLESLLDVCERRWIKERAI